MPWHRLPNGCDRCKGNVCLTHQSDNWEPAGIEPAPPCPSFATVRPQPCPIKRLMRLVGSAGDRRRVGEALTKAGPHVNPTASGDGNGAGRSLTALCGHSSLLGATPRSCRSGEPQRRDRTVLCRRSCLVLYAVLGLVRASATVEPVDRQFAFRVEIKSRPMA